MRGTDRLPTSYPQGNTHRLVVHQPDQASAQFERIEDLLADGLRHLRRALAVHDLPTEAGLALEPHAQRVRELVLSKRRLLSDDARHLVGAHLEAARRCTGEHGSTPSLNGLIEELAAALEASEWVADLLAAERDIAAPEPPAALDGDPPPAALRRRRYPLGSRISSSSAQRGRLESAPHRSFFGSPKRDEGSGSRCPRAVCEEWRRVTVAHMRARITERYGGAGDQRVLRKININFDAEESEGPVPYPMLVTLAACWQAGERGLWRAAAQVAEDACATARRDGEMRIRRFSEGIATPGSPR